MSYCLAPMLHDLGECGCAPAWSVEPEPLPADPRQGLGHLDGAVRRELDLSGESGRNAVDEDTDSNQTMGVDRDLETSGTANDAARRTLLGDAADGDGCHADRNAPAAAPIPSWTVKPIALDWSEYEADLLARGALDPDAEHGLWCPPDCPCGFELPDDIEEHNPLLGIARQVLDPRVAAMFLAADDKDRMMFGEGALHRFLLGAWHVIEPGTPFEDGEAIRAVCDHLQAQLEERAWSMGIETPPPGWRVQRAQNLLIRIPPRSLKTVISTIAATAWAWLRWPTMRILSLSSNPRVTSEGADKVRSLIRSEWYQVTFQPSWRIREDMDALAKLANTAGGWRAARGITSRITGEGADWLLIDDPHDGAEVYSKAKRTAVNDKWRRSTSNRVNDPRFAIRTGVMQGLHFDDWGEHRISDGWGLLLIRMEYQPGGESKRVGERYVQPDDKRASPYGWRDWRTEPGQTIHIRFTDEWRAQQRKDMGPIDWAAQYQQDPAPIDGGIVQSSDLRTYETLPTGTDGWAITVDASFKKTVSGSRVSVLVWCRKGPDRFLVDNNTAPMDMDETIAAIKKFREQYPRAKGTILVEDKANGSEIIRKLQLSFPGVIAVNPGNNSKESRLMACQSFFTGHCIYLPQYAPWLEDYKYELTQFPNAPKDDQVDATVQLLLYWQMSNAAARSRAGCVL
jgi:predicted phage terminase large subunit-like protein